MLVAPRAPPTAMRGNGATSCAVRAVHRRGRRRASSPTLRPPRGVGLGAGLRYFVDSSIDTCTSRTGRAPRRRASRSASYNPRTWDAGEHTALATRVAGRHFPERLPLKYAAEASARAEPLPAQAESLPPPRRHRRARRGARGGAVGWVELRGARRRVVRGGRRAPTPPRGTGCATTTTSSATGTASAATSTGAGRGDDGRPGARRPDAPESSPDAPPASSAAPAAGKARGPEAQVAGVHSSPDSSGGGSAAARRGAVRPGHKVKMVGTLSMPREPPHAHAGTDGGGAGRDAAVAAAAGARGADGADGRADGGAGRGADGGAAGGDADGGGGETVETTAVETVVPMAVAEVSAEAEEGARARRVARLRAAVGAGGGGEHPQMVAELGTTRAGKDGKPDRVSVSGKNWAVISERLGTGRSTGALQQHWTS